MSPRTPSPEPHELIDRLAAMTDAEFASTFYAAAARRPSAGLYEWRVHWVLGEAEKVGPGPWEIDFVAPAAAELAHDEHAICREAICSRCRSPVRSWARVASCPVCGHAVYPT